MNKIILTKDDVLRAQKHTLSNRAAARYLGVSYNVYKRYVLEGRVDVSHYTVDILKSRLIQEGYLEECCSSCGFNERRVVDFKVPLVLNFKDSNKKNWKRDNLEFLCYNCYFLNVGNIWSDNQLKQMEDYQVNKNTNNKDDEPTWDLDDTHIQHLKELGLWEGEDDDEFIDRI
jgi:5-methylcytosine-specific restriction endonuclease McrA